MSEALEQVQRDLNSVFNALALLGIKRCSQCKQFFRAEPGSLFDCGELICYGCVPGWWSSLSGQLGITEREKLEASLSAWLRRYHGAEVVTERHEEPPHPDQEEFQIVVHCTECHGSGTLLEGERCRFCKGRGTVWIVAPRRDS
ncbi:MAG: hypothetical protein LAP21_07645 [Acidobacteriia bacterium]|nr:hypothetical protein [Terriglobia bacterium]